MKVYKSFGRKGAVKTLGGGLFEIRILLENGINTCICSKLIKN
jgi:hypothetical protein